MRVLTRAGFGALLASLAFVITAPSAFAAATITEPSHEPAVVGVDGAGYPAPLTVVARGFEPYASVYIEQCDGKLPSDDEWRPSLDCELGVAPAPAIADSAGVATFSTADRNHTFRPFVGESPQQLFNCLGPKAASPKNDVEDYRDCQVRVSTNNTRSTDDQVFLRLELPNKARAWSPDLVPGPVAAGGPAAGANTSGGSAATGSGGKSASSASDLATSHPSSGGSESSGLDAPFVGALVLGAAAIVAGAFLLVHRRRTRQVAA